MQTAVKFFPGLGYVMEASALLLGKQDQPVMLSLAKKEQPDFIFLTIADSSSADTVRSKAIPCTGYHSISQTQL